MKQELFFGKLSPSHSLILPILKDIRDKYQIPEISPTDDGFKLLLEHELEIDWKAVQNEILTRVKDVPDFLPEKTLKLYQEIKKLQSTPLQDPEFEKVSQEFRGNVQKLVDAMVLSTASRRRNGSGCFMNLPAGTERFNSSDQGNFAWIQQKLIERHVSNGRLSYAAC